MRRARCSCAWSCERARCFAPANCTTPKSAARSKPPATCCGTGWIEADPELSLDELFDLLSKPEVAQAFPHLRQKSARKGDLLEALRADCADPRRFSGWYGDCPDVAWRILVKPLCDRLRLVFFGNLRQDWTDFVLSDLGLFRYEQVDISPASRGFRQRADIDHYILLHACQRALRCR